MKEIKISQVDALFSSGSYPIEFLFYYRECFETKKIRSALKTLSKNFWPVFGEYKEGKIFFHKYLEEDFYDEESASSELDISEFKEKGFEVYSRFHLHDLKKLFFLKVLRFKNGMVLIPKMNHIAGDGYSYFYFLLILAMLSSSPLIPLKSFLMSSFLKLNHQRTILRDFSFREIELKPIIQDERFTIEFEEISREEVRDLIKEVVNCSNIRISSNDVLSAIALRKIAVIKKEIWREEVGLTIPIDVRQQIKEYGPEFFGNGIMLHRIKFKKDEIKNSSTKEIAIKIRKSMPSISKETYITYLIKLEEIISRGEFEKFKPFDPERGCLVTNLSRLPADKLDFGKGPPELIIPLTIEKNSTGILARGENYILRYAF